MNILKNYFIGVFLLSFFLIVNSATKDSLADGPSNGISLFYLTDIKKHGAGISIDHNLLKTTKYTVFSTASLGAMGDPDFASSVVAQFSHTIRRTFRWGLFIEQSVNTGYWGTRYSFDLYKVNNDDEIVNVGHKWTHAVMVGSGTGLGYDFSKRTRANIQPYMKFNSVFRFPNNDQFFLYKNIFLQAGVTLHPAWLK